MNMPAPQVLFYALLLGALLGAMFTVLEAVRLLLTFGKTVTFFLDAFFCVLAWTASFLLALADTGGVLRLYQVVLEAVGFAAVYLTLTQAVKSLLPRLLRFAAVRTAAVRRYAGRIFGKIRKKRPEKANPNEKKSRFFGIRLKKSKKNT